MGSVGNQNPWAPYETYRDCSQGICSKYCPQWCYVFFPPPPTLELTDDDDSDTTFSPLIIAIIAILASGFLLVSYYIIITRVCRRGRHRRSVSADQLEASRDEISRDQWQVASTGLDEMLIKSITVCKYKKGDGLIEGTECAVCLNEFQENENLRLLPKCTHAFHLPCIDTWLKTHSNCPLCRSAAAPTSPSSPPPGQNSPSSLSLDVSALEIQRQNDLVLVVEDRERSSHRDEVVVSLVSDGFAKDHIEANGGGVENPEVRYSVAEIDEEGVKHFRRSISLGTFSCQRNLLIADILKIDEDDDIHGEISESQMGTASSKGPLEEQSKANCNSRELESTTGSVVMKRSTSNGRFDVIHDKGKNSIIPN